MTPTGADLTSRDHRIDWLRGLALAMIFINHMPGNWLENWTLRNFGFSDAAEAFVLLAGIASAFAYYRGFKAGQVQNIATKIARRARTLYLAHLASTVAAVSIFAFAAWALQTPDYLDLIGVGPLFTDPIPGIIGILTGGHQLGYFNILPLYVVLLVMAPALMWLARRDLRLMLAVSFSLYLLAQVAGAKLPSYPAEDGWYFNPLAWQLLFAIGLMLGALRLESKSLAWHPVAFAAALGYVAFSAVWMVASIGGVVGDGYLPNAMGTLHKSNLPATRLAHVLALAYVLVHCPAWAWLNRLSAKHPLTRMGRNSLPVFCAGSLLSMAGYVVLVSTGGGIVIETVLVVTGLSMIAGLAIALEDGVAALVPHAAIRVAREAALQTVDRVRTIGSLH